MDIQGISYFTEKEGEKKYRDFDEISDNFQWDSEQIGFSVGGYEQIVVTNNKHGFYMVNEDVIEQNKGIDRLLDMHLDKISEKYGMHNFLKKLDDRNLVLNQETINILMENDKVLVSQNGVESEMLIADSQVAEKDKPIYALNQNGEEVTFEKSEIKNVIRNGQKLFDRELDAGEMNRNRMAIAKDINRIANDLYPAGLSVVNVMNELQQGHTKLLMSQLATMRANPYINAKQQDDIIVNQFALYSLEEYKKADKEMVAVESTDDYADDKFMEPLDGSALYRLVHVSDKGLEAIDNKVYSSAEDVANDVDTNHYTLVSYDDIVYSAMSSKENARLQEEVNTTMETPHREDDNEWTQLKETFISEYNQATGKECDSEIFEYIEECVKKNDLENFNNTAEFLLEESLKYKLDASAKMLTGLMERINEPRQENEEEKEIPNEETNICSKNMSFANSLDEVIDGLSKNPNAYLDVVESTGDFVLINALRENDNVVLRATLYADNYENDKLELSFSMNDENEKNESIRKMTSFISDSFLGNDLSLYKNEEIKLHIEELRLEGEDVPYKLSQACKPPVEKAATLPLPSSTTVNSDKKEIEGDKAVEKITHGEDTHTRSSKVKTASDLFSAFEKGVKNILTSAEFANWCKKQATLYYKAYSLRNAILIHMQNPKASYVLGYNQWQLYGRQVKKGAESIAIIAPSSQDKDVFASLMKKLKADLKESGKGYVSIQVPSTTATLTLYNNGLMDMKKGNTPVFQHVPENTARKIFNQLLNNSAKKFMVSHVYDVKDTIEADVMFVSDKRYFKDSEIVKDAKGKPVTMRDAHGHVKYKIAPSAERKASFNEAKLTLHADIHENERKMEDLFLALARISKKRGVPVNVIENEQDDILRSGALGYYHRPADKQDKEYIVISGDLDITNRVSVLIHEMAHASLHKDVNALKDEMNKQGKEVDAVTRQMKEVQAEATAYIVGSAFGIKTDEKSFNYLAAWSESIELNDIQKSLDLVLRESHKLLNDIEKDLQRHNLDMELEPIVDKPLKANDIQMEVATNKKYIIDNMVKIEQIKKSLFADMKRIEDEQQQDLIKEQLLTADKMEIALAKYNNLTDRLEKSTTQLSQMDTMYQLDSAKKFIDSLKEKIDSLSEERIVSINEKLREKKNNIKMLYSANPLEAIKELQKKHDVMRDLSDVDLQFIAKSQYISKRYSSMLGKDDDKFVINALKQLDNFKSVLSKHNVAVEVNHCDNWSSQPVYKEGDLMHPRIANTVFAGAEKQIHAIRKRHSDYPTTEFNFTVYSVAGNNLEARRMNVYIGDGTQKDIQDVIKQIAKTDSDKKLYESFSASVRERSNLELRNAELVSSSYSNLRTMAEWKDIIESSNDNERSEERNAVQEESHTQHNTDERERNAATPF